MLNSTKRLKRNCKAILSVLFKKELFDDDKKFYLKVKFFVSNRNFSA